METCQNSDDCDKIIIASQTERNIQLKIYSHLGAYPTFYFKDERRHMNKCNSTVDIVFKEKNNEFSKYYLAITIIMSKCKYIICGSGNCSAWIMLYRGNSKNVYQSMGDRWISHLV